MQNPLRAQGVGPGVRPDQDAPGLPGGGDEDALALLHPSDLHAQSLTDHADGDVGAVVVGGGGGVAGDGHAVQADGLLAHHAGDLLALGGGDEDGLGRSLVAHLTTGLLGDVADGEQSAAGGGLHHGSHVHGDGAAVHLQPVGAQGQLHGAEEVVLVGVLHQLRQVGGKGGGAAGGPGGGEGTGQHRQGQQRGGKAAGQLAEFHVQSSNPFTVHTGTIRHILGHQGPGGGDGPSPPLPARRKPPSVPFYSEPGALGRNTAWTDPPHLFGAVRHGKPVLSHVDHPLFWMVLLYKTEGAVSPSLVLHFLHSAYRNGL